jgi:hypothetical protein
LTFRAGSEEKEEREEKWTIALPAVHEQQIVYDVYDRAQEHFQTPSIVITMIRE